MNAECSVTHEMNENSEKKIMENYYATVFVLLFYFMLKNRIKFCNKTFHQRFTFLPYIRSRKYEMKNYFKQKEGKRSNLLQKACPTARPKSKIFASAELLCGYVLHEDSRKLNNKIITNSVHVRSRVEK